MGELRDQLLAIDELLHDLRLSIDVDMVLISVGSRGPTTDCRNGNALATVTVGQDTETAEAVHLHDAILLAKAKCIAAADARKRAKERRPGMGEAVKEMIGNG